MPAGLKSVMHDYCSFVTSFSELISVDRTVTQISFLVHLTISSKEDNLHVVLTAFED